MHKARSDGITDRCSFAKPSSNEPTHPREQYRVGLSLEPTPSCCKKASALIRSALMSELARFNIHPPGETLSSHADHSEISSGEFRDLAGAMLRDLAPTVLSDVVSHLEDYPARLHSSGFRVRLLGRHAVLGDLRWHEYHPDIADGREPWGVGVVGHDSNGRPIFDGSIHDHAWGVAGLTIYGEQNKHGSHAAYSDRMYKVTPVTGVDSVVIGVNGLFRVFEAHYTPHQPVALETDGTVVRATPTGDRRIEVGEDHFIPPGGYPGDAWHAPTAPGGLAVTLAFNSRRMHTNGPHVLIAGPKTRYTTGRRTIPPEETLRTKTKILSSVQEP